MRSVPLISQFVWELGLFTCREDPRWFTCWRRKARRKCSHLAARRPAAAMFVFLVPSTRTFRAKVVYMVLGSSYLLAIARKILL